MGHDSEIDCFGSDQKGVAVSWIHWLVHEWVVPDEGEHTVRQRERRTKLLELHVVGDALEEAQDWVTNYPREPEVSVKLSRGSCLYGRSLIQVSAESLPWPPHLSRSRLRHIIVHDR